MKLRELLKLMEELKYEEHRRDSTPESSKVHEDAEERVQEILDTEIGEVEKDDASFI